MEFVKHCLTAAGCPSGLGAHKIGQQVFPGLNLVSQATPFAEKKGLITLQPSLPRQKLDVTNQICTLRRLHLLSWSSNTSRVKWMSAYYYLLFDNCVPSQQLNDCSVTTPFLSAKSVACKTSLVWGGVG